MNISTGLGIGMFLFNAVFSFYGFLTTFNIKLLLIFVFCSLMVGLFLYLK